jgi:hypothetical protein
LGFAALVSLIELTSQVPMHKPHVMSYMTMYDHYIKSIK